MSTPSRRFARLSSFTRILSSVGFIIFASFPSMKWRLPPMLTGCAGVSCMVVSGFEFRASGFVLERSPLLHHRRKPPHRPGAIRFHEFQLQPATAGHEAHKLAGAVVEPRRA